MDNLNPSEISQIIKDRINNLETTSQESNEGTIVFLSDGIARIHGLSEVMYGELIEFEGGITGMALNLERDSVGVVIFGDYKKLAEGDTATFKRAVKDLYYLTTASLESMYMAGKAFMNNANIIDSANQTVDMSKLNAIDVSERGFGIKAIHGFYTLPQRFLMAEDEFFKQVNFRAFIRAEIWERASKMKFIDNDSYNKYIEGEFKKIINVVNKESMLGKLTKQNALLYKSW